MTSEDIISSPKDIKHEIMTVGFVGGQAMVSRLQWTAQRHPQIAAASTSLAGEPSLAHARARTEGVGEWRRLARVGKHYRSQTGGREAPGPWPQA